MLTRRLMVSIGLRLKLALSTSRTTWGKIFMWMQTPCNILYNWSHCDTPTVHTLVSSDRKDCKLSGVEIKLNNSQSYSCRKVKLWMPFAHPKAMRFHFSSLQQITIEPKLNWQMGSISPRWVDKCKCRCHFGIIQYSVVVTVIANCQYLFVKGSTCCLPRY